MIRDMKGRMQCIHLKDLGVVGKEQQMRPVGEGNINFDRVRNPLHMYLHVYINIYLILHKKS